MILQAESRCGKKKTCWTGDVEGDPAVLLGLGVLIGSVASVGPRVRMTQFMGCFVVRASVPSSTAISP